MNKTLNLYAILCFILISNTRLQASAEADISCPCILMSACTILGMTSYVFNEKDIQHEKEKAATLALHRKAISTVRQEYSDKIKSLEQENMILKRNLTAKTS